jgi:IS30 family transposase
LRSRKGTSFENLTQAEIKEFITEINDRPRKILGWPTLAEIFQELCSQ